MLILMSWLLFEGDGNIVSPFIVIIRIAYSRFAL